MSRNILLLILAVGLFSCAPTPSERGEQSRGIVITGAAVLDGTGAAARNVNVRIEGDTIAAVDDSPPPDGYQVINGSGFTLAPGFIDPHSHGDSDLFTHRDALAAVSQGITTIVVGQDGDSPYPLADFFQKLESTPAAVNVASYAGHGTLRTDVMGDDFRRAATDEEVEKMRQLLIEEMKAGALGLGTGLEYDPGIYSKPEEVVTLAREAASWGGRYISHIRSEDRHFWEAIHEILNIGREAHLPVQISHTKLAMQSLWGQGDRLLGMLDDARKDGVEVNADIYPYTYWQSTLTVLFPARDFQDRKEAEFAVKEVTTPEGMLIPVYKPEPSYAGKTLAEIAKIRGTDPAQTLMDLIREAEAMRATGEKDVESVIATSMDEADIEKLMKWDHMSISTDGSFDGSHPRGFGTYPRVLGRYVRERKVLTLPEAIRKMTSLPASQMGFSDRGRIAPGLKADLVLFDPETVIDRATPEKPHEVSEGIDQVFVNGVLVYGDGKTTGAFPGRGLKRETESAKSAKSAKSE
jgi:N-acyl-D-amino-acid deacylase